LRLTNIAIRIATLALLLLFVVLGMWIGRAIPAAPRPWGLEHLRLLDDSFALEPASDITAIFTRLAGTRCEIRLDFLDLPDPPQYHVTLTLGGREIIFSDEARPPAEARLEVDATTDILLISLADCAPAADTPLVIQTAAERLATTFGAQTALQPVRLQFAFYNTFFPAATPIQALRRWDGAHTGPRGERHGLHGLLNAAEKHQIPLTLFETNTSAVLSAIDAVGGTEQIRRMEKAGLLAMPAGSEKPVSALQFEISRAGIPTAARQALLQGEVPMTIGGDFQRSTWGTYEYAEPSFAWLAARPYFSVIPMNLTGEPVSTMPANPISASAHEMRTMLANADPQLAQNYTGPAAVLEDAARWSENPAPLAGCQDFCVLASNKFYAVLNPRGGRLVFFFAGQEQIIGPTAQFFIGLSDRSRWDLSKGEGADPAQVMGAFAEAEDAFRPYQPEMTENVIRFVSMEGRVKTYHLTENGLEATFSSPFETLIPLVVAPQIRFSPGWSAKYHLERLPDGLRFGVVGGPMVRIQVAAGEVGAVDSFLDALPSLAFPENPNAELTPGYFLPFPMALVHLSAQQVSITVRE